MRGMANLVYIHMVEFYSVFLFSHKKKTNPTICNNMDGARGYYAQ